MSDVTQILSKIEDGDPQASAELLPLVYQELRRLAGAKMAQEKPGQTLQPTALVHEAFLRLVDGKSEQHWDSKRHFFSAASEAMRRILVERARRRTIRERHGQKNRVELDEQILPQVDSFDVLAFDEVLAILQEKDAQAAELVKLRIFAGLSHQEAAKALGVSRRVADRLWRVARAWISREMTRG